VKHAGVEGIRDQLATITTASASTKSSAAAYHSVLPDIEMREKFDPAEP